MNPFQNLRKTIHSAPYVPLLVTLAAILLLVPVQTSAQGRFGTIEGSVINSETGDPVIGATVGLFKPDGRSTNVGAFTGYEGEYAIPNVPPGRYQLKITMARYRAMEVHDVIVTVGVVTRKDVRLDLYPPSGIIRGRVTDQKTDEPIAAVNVFLLNTDGTATVLGAFTNADGEYIITNVPEGRYLLRAAMLRYKMVEVQNLLVSADATTTQHFQLEAIMTGSIEGTVVDEDTREPIDMANVFLFTPEGTQTTIGAFTDPKGRYVIINIPEGRYIVRAIYPDYHTVEVRDLLVTPGVKTTQFFRLKKR